MRVPSRLLTCLLLCSASAFAQSTAPGLWEMRNKMGGNPEMDKAMAEMKKQLASMPPAQRKQMEAMMGQRGLSVGAEGMSMKVCITPEMAAKGTFMKGRGCNSCGGGGYRGRIGIYELMLMTSAIRDLAFRGASTQEIRKVAIKNGMSTLYDDGIKKVLGGITTIEEVFRVAEKPH